MGSETVSNHLLDVVTKGTTHIATTKGPTDVCKVPPLPTPTPFTNYIESKQLGGGQTTKTFIKEFPIVTKVGVIEPMSNPAHAGVLGGVKSGTYRMECTQVGSSKDVWAEGNLVVRSWDATKQNHANTDGYWIMKLLADYLREEEENKKKRCTLVKVKGVCAHGRELGFPPGKSDDGQDGYYLEVNSDDLITLKAERKNVVPGEDAPMCPNATSHTHWEIRRAATVTELRKEASRDGDVQEIGRDILGLLAEFITLGSAKYKTTGETDKKNDPFGEGVNPLGKDQQDKINQDVMKERPTTGPEDRARAKPPGERTPWEDRLLERRDKKREDLAKDPTKAQDKQNKLDDNTRTNLINAGANLVKLAVFWNARSNPPVVEIDASACSGAKNVKIVVFPAGNVKFDIFNERFNQSLQVLRGLAKVIEKIAEWAGFVIKAKFLEKPQVSLTIEYKELKKDVPKKNLKKSQTNRAFELTFSFDPFLSIKFEARVPIPVFLAPMGAAIGKLLKMAGAEGVVFFSTELQIVPTANVRWDEYEDVFGYFKVQIKIEFQLGVRIRWRNYAEIWASGYVETTISFPEWVVFRDEPLTVKTKGELQIGFKGGGWGDIWGWKKSVEFNYRPANWKFNIGERWLKMAPKP